jgi:MscS family membrane protein
MMMKARVEFLYRGLLVLLAVGLFWVVWGSSGGVRAAEVVVVATTGTNAVTEAGAATPGGITTGIQLLPTLDRQRLSFGLDRVPLLRDHRFMGIPLWQYTASFIFIFLAFYVSKFLDFTARVWLKRWAERTTTKADDLLLELANGPVKVVAFVVLLHVGLSVFEWPPKVEQWISTVLKVVVGLSITYAALKVVDIAVGAWGNRTGQVADEGFNRQLVPILRKAIKALIVVVSTLVVLDNVGVNITGLIASLSIGGLALGLAAQDTVANLFGAVAVLVDKPFKVGDRVQFDQVDGVVEVIGLRSTRIRNLEGHLITVPNKTMGNATVTNVTLRPTIRTLMNIGLVYETTPEQMEKATRILGEVLRAHSGTKEVTISFNRFGDFSLNILVVHFWKDSNYGEYLKGLQEMNLEIKRRFDAEKLVFAFPTQTLYMKQDSEIRVQAGAGAGGSVTALGSV